MAVRMNWIRGARLVMLVAAALAPPPSLQWWPAIRTAQRELPVRRAPRGRRPGRALAGELAGPTPPLGAPGLLTRRLGSKKTNRRDPPDSDRPSRSQWSAAAIQAAASCGT